MRNTKFLLRQLGWESERNLLVRPAALLVLHVVAALVLPSIELSLAGTWPPLHGVHELIALEPSTAQLLMATMASSLMTVIAVVYSILLVALALASVQFSTRIVAGFMRDPVSRTVLGLFVGAFAYCLTIIRAVHGEPARVPTLSVLLGFVLTLVSLGALVLYIHHIARSIQANVLVDRIAAETESVIRDVFKDAPGATRTAPAPELAPHAVRAARSGYVQLIDIEGLVEHARARRRTIVVKRANGAFVAEGTPLLSCSEPVEDADARALNGCFDLGAERTSQEDAEWGFRQIVDIALKAISPAVNDPSTAATCIDHLGRLLVQVAQRPAPPTTFADVVHIPNTSFGDLIDLSIEQLRQYGRTDMAVCLRMVRVIADVADATAPDAPERTRLRRHATAIVRNAEQAHAPEDCDELRRRFALLQ